MKHCRTSTASALEKEALLRCLYHIYFKIRKIYIFNLIYYYPWVWSLWLAFTLYCTSLVKWSRQSAGHSHAELSFGFHGIILTMLISQTWKGKAHDEDLGVTSLVSSHLHPLLPRTYWKAVPQLSIRGCSSVVSGLPLWLVTPIGHLTLCISDKWHICTWWSCMN